MVRKKNNGPRCHGVEWQWEEMTETQETGREVFLHKQAPGGRNRLGKTKVEEEKAATQPGENVVKGRVPPAQWDQGPLARQVGDQAFRGS